MPTVGIARTDLTPYWGVELTGWGYCMNRCWHCVHDSLTATAVVVDDGTSQAVFGRPPSGRAGRCRTVPGRPANEAIYALAVINTQLKTASKST